MARFCSDAEKLCKRPRENDEDDAIEQRAQKKRVEKEIAERNQNFEWARRVAPCAAQILFRHFQHIREETHQQQTTTELSFDAIVLSLVHSGPEYIDDLSERLSDAMPSAEVDLHIRRLHSIAEALSSSDRVHEECLSEFMRLFNVHFDCRLLSGHIPGTGASHLSAPVQSTAA